MSPFRSLADYERFVYALSQDYPSIHRSTLTVIRRGRTVARLSGELEIGDCRIVVREVPHFSGDAGRISSYGDEIWCGGETLYWYDSQAHPGDPTLAATHPHHKHIPPDAKHHRVAAPELSFTRPNLPVLIGEVERRLNEEHAAGP